MRIIALMNQKGGVGKTTTTVNLGAALAERGARVCLIDMDPQAHLTINYGVEPSREECSLYDVLVDQKSILEAVHSVGERIGLVPSSIDLAAAEVELVSVLGREMLLKKRMEAVGVSEEFDYVLLDCPPSLGLLTVNALATAHEVIIPMQAHFLALQGVAKLLETVQIVNKRMNPRLRVSGIVLTMFDAQTKLSMEVVGELKGFIEQAKGKNLPWSDARVFGTRIRRNIKLAECPSFGQTILSYESSSNGAADYRALAEEVAGMPAVALAPAPTPPAPRQAKQPAVPVSPQRAEQAADRAAVASDAVVARPVTRADRENPLGRPAVPPGAAVDSGNVTEIPVPPLPLPPPPAASPGVGGVVKVTLNPRMTAPTRPADDAEVAA